MDYNKSYDLVAQATLSRPFKTKKHVCALIGVSLKDFEQWYTKHESFKAAVDMGFLTGETKARDLLNAAMLLPSAKMNTKMMLTMAADVYGISILEDFDSNSLPSKWVVEIVKAKDNAEAANS